MLIVCLPDLCFCVLSVAHLCLETVQTGVVTFQTSTSPPREIFRTHPFERPRLIFQLGSSDPELAVQAAKVIVNDVAGIGLNCGCPKPFSLSGGMGAALLQTPKKLCAVSSVASSLVKVHKLRETLPHCTRFSTRCVPPFLQFPSTPRFDSCHQNRKLKISYALFSKPLSAR